MDASLLCVMPIRDEVQHHGRSKLRVFDLNHASKSAMKAADRGEHRQAAGAAVQKG
jgi:hypothetical protein